MDLSADKLEILEALLLHDKPVKATQLAKEIEKEFPATQMHLIGLVKMGYADSPQKGQYLLSAKGKKALEIPEVTREKAMGILAQTPLSKAFHFYGGLGKPLNIYAHDLLEFCDKVDLVNAESVEFHVCRGDFEVWFRFLGDVELAKKAALLKKRKMSAEELRAKLREFVEDRCIGLAKLVGETPPKP